MRTYSVGSRAPPERPRLAYGTSRQSDHSLASHASSSVAPPPVRVLARVARITTHSLRLEREFNIANSLIGRSDPHSLNFLRPIQLVTLSPRSGKPDLIAYIAECPGENYEREIQVVGPAGYFRPTASLSPFPEWLLQAFGGSQNMPVSLFLDLAVSATASCEALHHDGKLDHGEIRGDSFHFDLTTREVRFVVIGLGARTLEGYLTSAGWLSLTRESYIDYKLLFVAPEQTGRLQSDPDTRTDIYSLGVLFWMLLTGTPSFEGSSPLELLQNILSKRIPPANHATPRRARGCFRLYCRK